MVNTQETLELVRAALGNPYSVEGNVNRAFTQPATATEGLIAYDLAAPSKKLTPILTPLRNKIGRVVDGFGTQANWQVVTNIDPDHISMGLNEGKRGLTLGYSTARYNAAYIEAGKDDYVTMKADLASTGFEDIKAYAQLKTLQAVMVAEEQLDLGGVGTVALGTANTPVVTDLPTLGVLAAATAFHVKCVALTLAGYQQYAGLNNGGIGEGTTLAALTQVYSATTADGTAITRNGGTSKPSADGTVTTATDGNATHRISCTTPVLAGAVAYAWYVGTAGGALYLQAVTTVNNAIFGTTALNVASQLFSALVDTDYSQDTSVYDGVLTQILKPGTGKMSGAVSVTAAAGAKLTSNGAGGIAEFDTIFQTMWESFRVGPDIIYLNARHVKDINKLVISGGAAPLYRFNMDGTNPNASINAGTIVGSVINFATGTSVQIVAHPNIPTGTFLFWTDGLPAHFPNNNVGTNVVKRLRRDYHAIAWPVTKRQYEYGVYFDGVLQIFAPMALACLQNITEG